MNDRIYTVTAGSPQELQSKISADKKNGKFDYTYISISLTDPKIYVYPFHLPKAPRPQLIAQLKDDAKQLLSMKDGDIELDFQIFNVNEEMLDGLFMCIPKKTIEPYIQVCDHFRLIPVHFTASILTCIGALFSKHKGESDSFCILDFTKDQHVNLAVFCNNKCEFIRRTHFESAAEARSDALQSIRSASAKSQIKTLEHIYIGGEAKEHKQLINEIVQDTHAELKEEACLLDEQAAFDYRENYFTVNLAHNYSFSIPRRTQFFLISRIILGVLALLLLAGFISLVIVQTKIAKLKSSFGQKDLQYARELKSKLESTPDAK